MDSYQIWYGDFEFRPKKDQSTTPDQLVDHSQEILVGHAWFLGSRGNFSQGIRILERNYPSDHP